MQKLSHYSMKMIRTTQLFTILYIFQLHYQRLLERSYVRLYQNLYANNILVNEQSEFKKNLSTVSHL